MKYRASILLPLCIVLTACGGGSGESFTTTVPAPTAMAEAIRASEVAGITPSLNRDATVLGPDADGNGVRDDIDAYIASLPDTTPQKSALKQVSAVLSKAMTVDLTNQTALLGVSRQMGAASACAHSKYDSATASKKSLEMEKLTVNTKARFDAYAKFSKVLSGTTFVLPQGDGCAN